MPQQSDATARPDILSAETARLASRFEQMRDRLLDMRLSNPMLNYRHRPTAKNQLQIVDEVPEAIYRRLASEGGAVDMAPLPEPDGLPADEQTDEFRAELDHAKVADLTYLTELEALENVARADDYALAEAETRLRVRLRDKLGLPPRLNRKTVNPAEHARSLGIAPEIELPAEASKEGHDDRTLQTLKWPDTLDATLEKIADGARLAEQEMGVSTLFLVFGFLEWAESTDPARRLYAPLLLLPVRLDARKTARGRIVHTLSATAGEAETNLSLQKKLIADFGIALPDFAPEEKAAEPLEDYFDAVRGAVADQAGWRVRRFVTLGHFAFGRLAMYVDLDPANWATHPAEAPLVAAILRGTETPDDGSVGLAAAPEDHDVDHPEIEEIAPYLVLPADASQHSAVIDVMKGDNLVIQGPPGTGKSQTITNVIANALAAGKTVLFLAEKMAALEVVKRRLDAVGLGDFCLEVHSDKATPKQIIQTLKQRDKRGYKGNGQHSAVDLAWREARRELSAYVEALHTPGDIGKPFDQFWRAIRTREAHGDLVSAFRRAAVVADVVSTRAGFERAHDRIARYAAESEGFAATFGPFEQSDWARLTFPESANPGLAYGLVDSLASLRTALSALTEAAEAAAPLVFETAAAIDAAAALDALLRATTPSDAWLGALAGVDPREARALAAGIARADALRLALPVLEGLDLTDAELRHRAAAVVAAVPPARRDRSPAAGFAEAESLDADGEAAITAATEGRAAALALGLAPELPASAMLCLLLAGRALNAIPAELRGLLRDDAGSADALAAIAATWRALVASEADWRTRFPGTSTPWPAAEALRAAEAERRKTGLSRLFADSRLVGEINNALGLPPRIKLSADDYGALAAHAAAMAAFTSDRQGRALFDDLWHGLGTPIEALVAARAKRAETAALVEGVPGGDAVAARLRAGDPGWIADAIAATPRFLRFAQLPPEIRGAACRSALGAVVDDLEAAGREARALLVADPEQGLAAADASLAAIGDALAAHARLDAAEAALAGHRHAQLVGRFRGDPAGAAAALDWLETLARAEPGPLATALSAPGASALRQSLAAAIAGLVPLLARVRAEVSAIADDHGVGGFESDDYRSLLALIGRLAEKRDELSQWLSVFRARAEASEAGLGGFLTRAGEMNIAASQLPALFSGLVAQQRGDRLRRSDAVLSKATGAGLSARRAEFARRDRARLEQDRQAVANRVIAGEALAGAAIGSRRSWTEGAFLNNEFGKAQAFRPVRELMTQAGRSVLAMKPCFMMSPLSLAKFVPARSLSFDLLVIDEASQMRPEDALGGLLRARQIVVVGDPKQLPPTDFFQRTALDAVSLAGEAVGDDDEDDESILEACHKTFRQLRLLKWHYRSRCESLIAFSNREIYAPEGRQLITFPAAAPGSFSIDRIRVRGAFEASRNAPEAQRMAEEALQFMHRHAEAETPPTLGLVAMNAPQAELIQEELRLRWSGDQTAELYRSKVAARGEPVFVKNLENVQGDERDAILISLTYGPKPGEAVVRQTFGPITRKQGDRRLNVLFTRARMRIGLVTSMDSSDVKPSETSSRGVHLLKKYLAYVETAGGEAGEVTGREPDSDFELHVADRLAARGFEIRHQVGVSGYRIDLGVIDPARPGAFLAGIECDGAPYHAAKSARDRDRLRQEVLEGLGWTILRVWSTDWFDNPDRQADRLAAELTALVNAPQLRTAAFAFDRSPPPAMADDAEPLAVPDAGDDGAAAAIEDAPSEAVAPDEVGFADISQIYPAEAPAVPGDPAEPAAPDEEPWTAARLSPAAARVALAAFRDRIVAPAYPDWEPERSLLRAGLIETFIEQRIEDEADWFARVPLYQRRNTSGPERQRFLADVCDIVSRIGR